MATCPSCSSVSFASATATQCSSTWTITLNSCNPFLRVTTYIEYEKTGWGLQPNWWENVELKYDSSTHHYLSDSLQGYYHQETSGLQIDNKTNYNAGSLTLYHQCGAVSYFQKNGSGNYRIRVVTEYTDGTICEQYSNTLAITIGGASPNPVDLTLNASCGCRVTDATYGADAVLAYNYYDGTPTCDTGCRFETCPTFFIDKTGDVVYQLPRDIQGQDGRTVKLFDASTVLGVTTSKGIAAENNRMYLSAGISSGTWPNSHEHLVELSYDWPGTPSLAGGTATSFKIGKFDYTGLTWTSNALIGGTPTTGMRQRYIEAPNTIGNYSIAFTSGRVLALMPKTTMYDLNEGYPGPYTSATYGGFFNPSIIESYEYGLICDCSYNKAGEPQLLEGLCLLNLHPGTMSAPETIGAADIKPLMMFPEKGIYTTAARNYGLQHTGGYGANIADNASGVNGPMISEYGFTAAYNYYTKSSGDAIAGFANGGISIWTALQSQTGIATGVSSSPCSGKADCPPFYHSSDANAPHATTAYPKFLERFEYATDVAGSLHRYPTVNLQKAQRVRFVDGTCSTVDANSICTDGEGWYHIGSRELHHEIYDLWSSTNIISPVFRSASKQHWIHAVKGLGLQDRASYISYQDIYNQSFFITSHEVPHADNQTWMYSFDPFTVKAQSAVIPTKIDHAYTGSPAALWEVYDATSCFTRTGGAPCADPLAMNYDPNALLGNSPSGYEGQLVATCLYCDLASGNVEGTAPGDDGLAGDLEESFKLIDVSTTPATWSNWGDGTISMTVEMMPLFAASFPNPSVDWRYKAELYRVNGPGIGWQDPMSYIVAGGIQDQLTTPIVSFASSTYPVPLLVPEGHYSVKWSINVITAGVYEIEECWWEFPASVASSNQAADPPIFALLEVVPSLFSLNINVYDTSRGLVMPNLYPGSAIFAPPFNPGSLSHACIWEGSCIDVVTGSIITEPNFNTPALCTGAGHTWQGYDPIANVEDITATHFGTGRNYADNSAPMSFTHPYPVLSTPVPNGYSQGYTMNYWTAGGGVETTPNWHLIDQGSMWPSEKIAIKVTWQSGWTKTFEVNTPIIYGYTHDALPHLMGHQTDASVLPCTGEMWPTSQYQYNEMQRTQSMYNINGNPNPGISPKFATSLTKISLHNPDSSPNYASAHPIANDMYRQTFLHVEEMPTTPAPTYPITSMYDGVAPSTTNSTAGWHVGAGTHEMIYHSMTGYLQDNGTSLLHAGMIIGGFTGEIQLRFGVINIPVTWADANPGLMFTPNYGPYGSGGTGDYDDFINMLQAGTGVAGVNNYTAPAGPAPGVGTSGTITEGGVSGMQFADSVVYGKDCPVCLPPSGDVACRWRTGNSTGAPFIGGTGPATNQITAATISYNAINYITNFPFATNRSTDDGSCLTCHWSTGKLMTDGWDPTDDSPAHWEFYKTNPPPVGNAGGGPGQADYNTGTIVEGTGNILENTFPGINYVSANTSSINISDTLTGSFAALSSDPGFYKMESVSSTYLGHAMDTLDYGEIEIQTHLYSQFILAIAVSKGTTPIGSDLQMRYELSKWDGSAWIICEERVTTDYFNGVPTTMQKFTSATSTTGTNLSYGQYKLRVRAELQSEPWTGQEKISLCYQDLYFNFRVRVCDTHFNTTNGINIPDANDRIVDPSLNCSCCEATIPTLIQTGNCTIGYTQNITANFDCTPDNLATAVTAELWFTPAGGPGAGVPVSLGNFPAITGAPVTSGTMAFGSNVSGNAAIYGGDYYIVSTYTTTSGVCDPLTSPSITVSPLPTCDCQDTNAVNWLTVFPGGNADCAGVIGGTDYSCCSYPTSCDPPVVAVTSDPCNVTVTLTNTCDLTTPPDDTPAVRLQFFDLSTSGGVYVAAQSMIVHSHNIAPGNVAPSLTYTLTNDCNGNQLAAFSGTGPYIVRQVQQWIPSYIIESFSNTFDLYSGTNPTGTTDYPVICGCTNAAAGNYNPLAACDDGSCLISGCTDGGLTAYDATIGLFANIASGLDDGITANNYDPNANFDDGTCTYNPEPYPAYTMTKWIRLDCNNGWCNPRLEIGWTNCEYDMVGNFIEYPDTITILFGFSTDDGATWTDSTQGTIWGVMPQNGTQGWGVAPSTEPIANIFFYWFQEGLIATSDPFDCRIRWEIKATYPNYPDAYSSNSAQIPGSPIQGGYKEFLYVNPHTVNSLLPLTGYSQLHILDQNNGTPGQQTYCNASMYMQLFTDDANMQLAHAGAPGENVIVLAAPCGCTDDGSRTIGNTWATPTAMLYNSPFPGTAATNVMANPALGIDNGSCEYHGCMDPGGGAAYDPNYTHDCTSICGDPTCCCIFNGCTDPCATNYDPTATVDDSSCILPDPIISGSWSLGGCAHSYTMILQDSSFSNAAWGFLSAAMTVTHDGTSLGTFTVSTTIPNFLTVIGQMSCSTGTYNYFTQGVGTYVFDFVISYPSGCTDTISHTVIVDSTHITVCDCMNCPTCSNYNPNATCDDGSCLGCTDWQACNYHPFAQVDDGSCYYCGCTDPTAANYDANATVDDGSCLWWHIWQACGTSDQTSIGTGNTSGAVSLAQNNSALLIINPLAVPGQVFTYPYSSDGLTWTNTTQCWEYIGQSNTAAYYNAPNSVGPVPSQWIAASPATTYADCIACMPVPGCTDPLATNYNASATVDDGSCVYPCCDVPTLAQAAGHLDSCDAEYVMNINCNSPATDNADTIVTTLEFDDNGTWQVANTNTHNPGGTDNIASHTLTYHYNCSADDFGGYGTGTYRIKSVITYSNGHTCTQYSTLESITLDSGGCTDPTANNYDPNAVCQCVTCLFTHCCDTPVLTLDLSNGICDQSLECSVTCTPAADDGYTALWQRWDSGSWTTIQTDTSSAATGGVTLTLPNALLHTASGTSENYRVAFTSDYTAPTPDCQVISNTLTVVAPILGCMDGGATEYNVTIGTPGDNITDGLIASNYDPTAQCPGVTCCIDGCTDPLATNYNWNTANSVDVTTLGHAAATCDDGGCIYACCSNPTLLIDTSIPCSPYIWFEYVDTACPATPTQITIDWVHDGNPASQQIIAAPVTNTIYSLSNGVITPYGDGTWTINVTLVFGGTSIPNCIITDSTPIILPVFGCTNPFSPNYNPLATCDDGSCLSPILGCTDPTAVNFHPTATQDDGTCIYCGIGCTDAVGGPYSNYDAAAICDCDGYWLQEGYCDDGAGNVALAYDPTACGALGGGHNWVVTYNNNTTSPTWNTCCLACVYGCTNVLYSNYNPAATCPCTETLGTEPCNASTLSFTGDDCCCTSCVYGCTDDGSHNQGWWDGANIALYDYATATGIITYGLDPNDLANGGAINYDANATCEDGSCLYAGCTDCGTYWESQNGLFCDGIGPASTVGATNYNPNLAADCARVNGGTDYTCCTYPAGGCTDGVMPALNYDPLAVVDDGSCMYCDVLTGNYEDAGGVDQATWATGTYVQTPTTDPITTDGTLFVSFSLTATGVILQNTPEFLSGTSRFAIELYSVVNQCDTWDTGALIVSSPNVPTTQATITHLFTNLPFGYYAAKLVVNNLIGTIEPTECWIDLCTEVHSNVCTDPTAANCNTCLPAPPVVVPAPLVVTDDNLCVYPGYCACTIALTTVTGPICTNTADINATLTCAVATDISWQWLDSNSIIIASGTTAAFTTGIISTLPITANGTYTFQYDETSTPYLTCPTQSNNVVVTSILNCACTDSTASNYDATATHNCLGLPVPDQSTGWNAQPCCLYCIYGCTSATALNYNPLATCDDGSCIEPGDGCCDPLASNYNSFATNCVPALCEYCND